MAIPRFASLDTAIIGGADGPTSIYLSGNLALPLIAAAAVIAVVVILALRVKRKKRG